MKPAVGLLLALGLALAPARAERWRLATVELPPSISEQAPGQGYYAVLLRRILAEAGHSVEFVFLPPQRAMEEAAAGRWDGVFPYRRTASRERQFLFSEPFFVAKVRVFLRADDPWEPADAQALRGQTGCTLQGAQAPEALQREVDARRVPLQRVAQIDACFRMLQLQRVRFVVAGQNTGWDASQRLAGEGLRLRAAALVLAEEPVHLAVGRKVPQAERRLQAFNQALRQLRASGALQQLEAQQVPHHRVFDPVKPPTRR
jgi:polar amino acid transport system substrate-binding protein